MPATAGRAELSAWMEAKAPRFQDWDTAIREQAAIVGSEAIPALAAYVRPLAVG
jgi:hypothetical protein